MSFVSKLTTKHKQLSSGKHTHSASLAQVTGNSLMPMLMEGFILNWWWERWEWELPGMGKGGPPALLAKSCGG